MILNLFPCSCSSFQNPQISELRILRTLVPFQCLEMACQEYFSTEKVEIIILKQ